MTAVEVAFQLGELSCAAARFRFDWWRSSMEEGVSMARWQVYSLGWHLYLCILYWETYIYNYIYIVCVYIYIYIFIHVYTHIKHPLELFIATTWGYTKFSDKSRRSGTWVVCIIGSAGRSPSSFAGSTNWIGGLVWLHLNCHFNGDIQTYQLRVLAGYSGWLADGLLG